MGAHLFASLVGMVLLLSAGFSHAENAARIEPLDGTHSVLDPASGQRTPLAPKPSQVPAEGFPQTDVSPRPRTPFADTGPPNYLTPAPLLPFNPNRSLMPSPAAPSHPPGPSRAEPRVQPAPFSGSGRAGR